jgi:hypothetical protein
MTAALAFAAELAVACAALDVMVAPVEMALRTRCARCRQAIEQ